jgi:UDPglucose--hexose-1-phosphate uridylyltransferase
MGVHQRPTDKNEYAQLQMHIHFEPPWLTPSRLKFMVGYERFGEQQRDITPEQAAQTLKKVADSLSAL